MPYKTLIKLALFFVFLNPTSAESYYFDQTHSSVGFEVGYIAGTCHGKFKKFEGRLDYNKEQPERSEVSIVIQVDSVDTNSVKRDTHLQQEDFFHSSRFPTITFKSESFRKRGNKLIVTGPLNIHGVSKPVTLHVQLKGSQTQWAAGGDALLFDTEYELNRLDFGVGEGQPGIDKQIRIRLNIKALESDS